MLDRRHFLIGVGSLLTATFVRKATAFSQALREPLILPPPRRPEETLYIYVKDWIDYEANDDEAKWRVTLGHDEPVAPPVPTWRDYLHSLGHRLDTNDDIARACRQHNLDAEELDTLVDGFWWEDRWDNFTGPQARAYHLLKNLDLAGAPNSKLKQAGEIFFQSCGGAPGNTYTSVELKDDLTVSLLQARLIELNLPIKVKAGTSG
jgi:hypothetical protein